MNNFSRLKDSDTAYYARGRAVAAYCAYLEDAKRRNLEGVLKGMTARYRVSMLALSRASDFWPFFDLWCDDQSRPIEIQSCDVHDDTAELVIRAKRMQFSVRLRYESGHWRLDSEQLLAKAQSSHRPEAAVASVVDENASLSSRHLSNVTAGPVGR